MATLATLIDWIFGVRAAEGAVRETAIEDYLSRPLPNEHLYFWVRPIDNSKLKAQAAPEASRACVRSIVASLLAVIALVLALAPFAYNLLAGYQIRTLEAELEGIRQELALLEKEEAELSSAARLAAAAEARRYVDPEPAQLVPLAPAPDGAVARTW